MLTEQKIQNIIADPEAGMWLIDKPTDWTSHDVVAKLRGLSKIKVIGHTGTLDPFATGLLICLTGKATKLVDYFHDFKKTYLATIKLGCVSDTFDRTGQILNAKSEIPALPAGRLNKSKIQIEEIQKTLTSFIGKQQQLPPMFSAKKIAGQKLYKLARQGKSVERELNEIEIYSLDLISFDAKALILEIRVVCSTGTYIRSLAHDLGEKLGTGAVLWELRREIIGPFGVNEAIILLETNQGILLEKMIKPAQILAILPKLC
ncbi:MAG: tRNA pseudouridine(55) synthase TruB [Candidatus Komeilibacteria bacterium]|nr:tRNA pseudouridine(55) synthase TruB [Candidatus Komeilibacteria bacterium]